MCVPKVAAPASDGCAVTKSDIRCSASGNASRYPPPAASLVARSLCWVGHQVPALGWLEHEAFSFAVLSSAVTSTSGCATTTVLATRGARAAHRFAVLKREVAERDWTFSSPT